MTTDNNTAAALAYAEAHAYPLVLDLGDDRIIVRNPLTGETEQVDKRPESEGPRRQESVRAVHDADSFVLAVTRYTPEDVCPTVVCDAYGLKLSAILDDDNGGRAGWRDDRVVLALRKTDEWAAWLSGQGLGPQVRFAERIEDGLPEIAEPDGSTMLEIAQTFHAATEATFQSSNRLANGEVQFGYVENVKASAGSKPGTLTIPETFTIVVRPFVGSASYKVTARLRYRMSGGELQIGYTLVRPTDVERDAFGDVASAVRDGLPDADHLNGEA